MGFPDTQLVKNLPATGDPFDSWVGKICGRRDRLPTPVFLGFPCGPAGKESTHNARDLGSISGLGRFLGVGNVFISTLVFLLGKSHGQRSLVGHSQWGPKKLDTTEQLHFHFSFTLAK